MVVRLILTWLHTLSDTTQIFNENNSKTTIKDVNQCMMRKQVSYAQFQMPINVTIKTK